MGKQLSQNKAYLSQLGLGAIALLLLSFCTAVFADERAEQIINKAIKAYGGDKLTQLQSMTLTDHMNHYSPWQSGHSAQGSMIMYLSKYRTELTIDLQHNRKVFKQATARLVGGHGTEVPATSHRIFAEGKGYVVDHALQQYHMTERINYNNADNGHGQLLDPLIIIQLSKERNHSQWTDIAYIQGQAHDVLTVNARTQDEYTLYISQKTGLLTRMLKKRGEQIRSYDFLNHQQSQGITWAKELFVSTATQPIYHSDARELSFNKADNQQFNLPANYKRRATTQAVDVSQLTIREIAPDVYFVGKEWGYTLFIDAGSHYISAGSWQVDRNSNAWQQSLALLRKTTGNNKPVKQHIVTHHHNDHMMGLEDIVEHGANLVIHPTDIAAVKEHLQQPLADSRFIPTLGDSDLANGKVMLFDIPNSHASHNLVIYLPEHKILFTEDVFGSGYQKAFHSPSSWPSVDTYHRLEVLTNRISHLELEVDQYVSSHHARILNHAEIEQALAIKRPSKAVLLKRLFAENLD